MHGNGENRPGPFTAEPGPARPALSEARPGPWPGPGGPGWRAARPVQTPAVQLRDVMLVLSF